MTSTNYTAGVAPESSVRPPLVLLTLRTRCGCVGQGLLGADITWDSEPVNEAVQAIFSRLDPHTMAVLEVFEINGDDWREYEDNGAEAAFRANVANGYSIKEAFELIPAGISESFEQQR